LKDNFDSGRYLASPMIMTKHYSICAIAMPLLGEGSPVVLSGILQAV
jgi:hypothetical protein